MKLSNLSRIIALICAVLMLISAVACTKDPETPKESESESQSQAQPDNSTPEDTDPVEVYNPNGTYGTSEEPETLMFIGTDMALSQGYSINLDIWVEAFNGDILNDNVMKRNIYLKDTIGVEVMFTHSENFTNIIRQDISSGDYIYEIINPQYNDVVDLFNAQLLSNIANTGIDLSYSWFDKECSDIFSVQGKVLAIAPEFIYIDDVCTPAVIYNRELVTDNAFGNLYEMVNNKTWTWDKMIEMSEVVTSTNEDDGEYTLEDFYGISSQNDFAYYMLHSAGLTTLVKNSKGEFVYNGTNETLVDCLSDVYTLMSNPKVFLNRQGTVGSTVEIPAILDHFAEGLTLFLIRPVESLFGLKDRTDNLGIIPLPLYYEGQENYYSATNTWVAGTLCLPSYVGNAAKIVDSIQLLSMKAQEIVTPALYEVCLGQRLIHEPDSAKMLDIIFDNKTYDFGFTFNVGSIRNTIVKKGNAINTGASSIARDLASLERVMTGWLTQFNTVIGKWE